LHTPEYPACTPSPASIISGLTPSVHDGFSKDRTLEALMSGSPPAAHPSSANRWVQSWLGVLCMMLIANLQYAWTLFVEPMRQAHGWKLVARSGSSPCRDQPPCELPNR
jgi:hypothetical protein